MRKAKAIQAEARDMQEKSRSNPQQVPDFTQPEPKAKAKSTASKQVAGEVHKAAGTGQLNELQLLEAKGFSMTAPDADLNTPLHLAAYRGQKEIVDYLLSRPGLLKDPVDTRGLTPLMLAAGAGHLNVIESLLAAGCDIHLKSQDGGTALHRAASQGYLNVVERLLEAGCDANLVDAKGKTPLQLAQDKRKGDWELISSRLKQAQSQQP
jgi:ankyrin repeat protein